ncbi:hypothetical protein P5673_001942 [Acropora cervicornis]|uniref:Uncharacterized protein n=1 Tax=Acropora cervicornis TaxID=6130 RepID=A0AAD9VFV1_ACRCE|nr:hypothetical protein P5673_001942 [Acropora cervicornis]
MPDEQQSFRTIKKESGSRGSDLELEQLIIAMALNDVKEIKETVDADCKTFKKEVQEIRNHLKNAKEESQALESTLSDSFKRVKNMFFFDDRPRINDVTRMECAAITVSQLDHRLITEWKFKAEEIERKVPIIADLLRMIRRELEGLGKKTKEKTDEMLKELAQLKTDAQLQHRSLKSKNEGLDKKFLEIEELIQGCCTIKKIPLSTLEGSRD